MKQDKNSNFLVNLCIAGFVLRFSFYDIAKSRDFLILFLPRANGNKSRKFSHKKKVEIELIQSCV